MMAIRNMISFHSFSPVKLNTNCVIT